MTGVDLNRVGTPEVLQFPVAFGAPVAVTGVDMPPDGFPDVLLQPLILRSLLAVRAPVQYTAPAFLRASTPSRRGPDDWLNSRFGQ